MYLLDTNVLSNLGKQRPTQEVVDWCNRLALRHWCIAQCSVMEIRRGIKLLYAKNDLRRGNECSEWFKGIMAMKPRVVPLDSNVMEVYTDLSVIPHLQDLFAPNPGRYPAKVGRDLEIAATAIAIGAFVVTLNVKDFDRINRYRQLPGVFNPETGEWCVRPRKRSAIEAADIDGPWDRHRKLGMKQLRGLQ